MRVRPLQDSDIPILRQMFDAQGFEYQFPDLRGPLMEAVHVVADDENRPLCAVAAERMTQLYFLAGDFGPPHARLHALRLLHSTMATELKRLGYNCTDAYIPPNIAETFGRWLERRFGWRRNWKSWAYRF